MSDGIEVVKFEIVKKLTSSAERIMSDGDEVWVKCNPDTRHDFDELRAAVGAIEAGAEKVELSTDGIVENNYNSRICIKFGDQRRTTQASWQDGVGIMEFLDSFED